MMMVGSLVPMTGFAMSFLGALAGVVGAIFLILGIISLVIAFGLFTGRGWAWLCSLIFAVIGIVLALLPAVGTLGSAILPIIIYFIIIYYLTRSHVKAFFGK